MLAVSCSTTRCAAPMTLRRWRTAGESWKRPSVRILSYRMTLRTRSHGVDGDRSEALLRHIRGVGSGRTRLAGLPPARAEHHQHPGQRNGPGLRYLRLSRVREGLQRCAGRDYRVRRLPVPLLSDLRHAPDADHRGSADQGGPAPLAVPRLSPATAPVFPAGGAFGGLCRRAGEVLAAAR